MAGIMKDERITGMAIIHGTMDPDGSLTETITIGTTIMIMRIDTTMSATKGGLS
jgi:hypothetical protein